MRSNRTQWPNCAHDLFAAICIHVIWLSLLFVFFFFRSFLRRLPSDIDGISSALSALGTFWLLHSIINWLPPRRSTTNWTTPPMAQSMCICLRFYASPFLITCLFSSTLCILHFSGQLPPSLFAAALTISEPAIVVGRMLQEQLFPVCSRTTLHLYGKYFARKYCLNFK